VFLVLHAPADDATGGSSSGGPGATRSVEALAKVSWRYEPLDPSAPPVVRGPGVGDGAGDSQACGVVTYAFDEIAVLESGIIVDASIELGSPASCLRLSSLCSAARILGASVVTSVRQYEQQSDFLFTGVLVVSIKLLEDALSEVMPFVFRSVPLTKTVEWDRFLCNTPTWAQVRRWKADSGLFTRHRAPLQAPRSRPAACPLPAVVAGPEDPQTSCPTCEECTRRGST
jgi:hypothetical protein